MSRLAALAHRLAFALAARAEAIETAVGVAVLAAGVALVVSSLGAALIVVGAALLAPHVWPHLGRRR